MRFGQYQAPHQLWWSDREMGTAISCTECSLVAACVGPQNCNHQLNRSVHSHSNVRTVHMGQPCLDPHTTVQSQKLSTKLALLAQKANRQKDPAPVDTQTIGWLNYTEKSLAPSNIPLAGWPWHLRQEEGVKMGGDTPQNKKLTRARKPLSSARPMKPRKEDFTTAFGSSNRLKVN